MARCSSCDRPLRNASVRVCGFCGRSVAPPLAPAEAPSPDIDDDGREPAPWELRKQIGVLPAFIETTKAVCTRPVELFSKLRAEGDLVSPLLYGLLVGSVGLVAASVPHLVIGIVSPSPGLDGTTPTAAENIAAWTFFALLSPVILTFIIFSEAAITHLVLLMTGAQRRGFEATLRASCYARGTWIFFTVPIVGCVTVPIWFVVVRILALMHLHCIGGGRASLAVLGPNVVCCVVSLLLQLLFFGLAFLMLLGVAAGAK